MKRTSSAKVDTICNKICNYKKNIKSTLMRGLSDIQSVLIGVKYRNCCRTLNVYLLFAIWMGKVQSKLIYIFVTYERVPLMNWPVCKLQVCNLVLI